MISLLVSFEWFHPSHYFCPKKIKNLTDKLIDSQQYAHHNS